MEELTQEQKNKVEKLFKLQDDSNLAIFDELEQMNETLEKIYSKEEREYPEMPEPLEEVSIKNFPDIMRVEVINQPEMPKMECDMSKTNSLLQKLIDKESEPEKDEEINITATLNII